MCLPGRMRIPGYTIDGPIGSGSAGVTWLARDRRGEAVAVRLLQEQHGSTPLDEQRLQRLQELRHPHLAHVTEVLTTEEGYLAVVSEAVPGPTLATARISRGGLSAPEALGVGADLASALAAMHAAEIVHGDVSPNNVVLVPRRGAVLVDLVGEPAAEGGTGEFAAPERGAGDAVLPSDDVYGLARLVIWLGRSEDRGLLRERVGTALAPKPRGRCSMADLHHRLSEAGGAGVNLPAGPVLAGAALRDHAQREETRRIADHGPRHRRETNRRPIVVAGAVATFILGAGTWWFLASDAGGEPGAETNAPEAQHVSGADGATADGAPITPPSDPSSGDGAENGGASPRGDPDAGALADPAEAAENLTRARDRAINGGDAEGLRALTAPGSPAAHNDADFVEALAAGDVGVEGLRTVVTDAETLASEESMTPEGASELEGEAARWGSPPAGDGQLAWVRVQLSTSEYTVTDAQGRQVHPAAQRCAVLGLLPADSRWHVARIEPC